MENDDYKLKSKVDVESNFTYEDINNKNKLNQNLKQWIVKRKFAIINYFLIILLVAGGGAYFYLNNPIKIFKGFFDNGKYEQAMSIYNQNSNDSNFKNSINEYLVNKSDELKTVFNDEKITYEDALKELDQFSKLGLNNDEINSKRDLINKINDSMTAYKNGKQQIKDKKSFESIDSLSKVIKEDKNYDDAQKLIKEQLDLGKKQKLDEAQNYASQKDYKNALNSIESILKYLPDDAELKDKENNYNQLKIDEGKENALGILTKKDSGAKYIFNKMVTINKQQYYGFEAIYGEMEADSLYCVNADTGEIVYYKDDAHYMTEKQMEEEKAKAKAQKEANKTSITSNSSGINYTIQSITYSQAANVSQIYIKCSNFGNKAFVVTLTITFYNSNNQVIGQASSGVNLEPNQSNIINPMCGGNVKSFDHFSVDEGLFDNTELYKAKQEINEKYGFH